MKFTIDRAPFIKALGHIQSIVERRNTIPILSNVRIHAGQAITLTATDLDLEAVETVTASVSEAGDITVSANLINDIVKKFPDGAQVSVELKDGKLIVKSGRSRFQLPTIPSDDFPSLPFIADQSFTLSGDDLITAIDKTRFAMSMEETRYYLNGLFWHSKDGLTIVATDGNRLATHNIAVPYNGDDMIVPRKAINEVRKIVSGGNLTIETAKDKIRFIIDNVTLTSKLIDGTFPDYQRVIPQNNVNKLDIDPRALKLAIERVTTIANEKTKGVKLTISADIVTVSVVSPDNGAASEDIPCSYSGGDLEIGFNSIFLRDALGVIDGETVRIDLSDAGGPALIGGRFVVMPMRI